MKNSLYYNKQEWFNIFKLKKSIHSKNNLIIDICRNKTVLDVGCVGQDLDYNHPEWIHRRIKNIAANIDGVDINEEGIKKLSALGYSVFHISNLEKSDKKYDVILMLDVIEHVNDPVTFLSHYQNFLKDNGKIIITTPNANRALNFLNIFFRDFYSLNNEHICWFCPKTLSEVVIRAGNLNLSDFYWLNHYKESTGTWKTKIISALEKLLIKYRKGFSPNFMFVLGKDK